MQGSVNLANLGLLEFKLVRGVGAGHTFNERSNHTHSLWPIQVCCGSAVLARNQAVNQNHLEFQLAFTFRSIKRFALNSVALPNKKAPHACYEDKTHRSRNRLPGQCAGDASASHVASRKRVPAVTKTGQQSCRCRPRQWTPPTVLSAALAWSSHHRRPSPQTLHPLPGGLRGSSQCGLMARL